MIQRYIEFSDLLFEDLRIRESKAGIERFLKNNGKGSVMIVTKLPDDLKIVSMTYDPRYARYKVYVESEEFTNNEPEEIKLVCTVVPKTQEVVQFT